MSCARVNCIFVVAYEPTAAVEEAGGPVADDFDDDGVSQVSRSTLLHFCSGYQSLWMQMPLMTSARIQRTVIT